MYVVVVVFVAGAEELVDKVGERVADEPVHLTQPGGMCCGDGEAEVFVPNVEGVPEVAMSGFGAGVLGPGPHRVGTDVATVIPAEAGVRERGEDCRFDELTVRSGGHQSPTRWS